MGAIANREKIETLEHSLHEHADVIAEAIPALAARFITPERAIRAILFSVEREPLLLACTPASLLTAAIQAVQYGLEPGGVLGEAALIPYADRCEMRIMCAGLVTLAIRHGAVRQVDADCVRENDEFEYERGLAPRLIHRPVLTKAPGAIVCAYAIARLEDGGQKFEVAPRWEIERARLAPKSRAWKDWPGEMAKKFAVRRLLKLIPKTPELAEAIDRDYSDERPEFEPSRGEALTAPPPRSRRLARVMNRPIAGLDEMPTEPIRDEEPAAPEAQK